MVEMTRSMQIQKGASPNQFQRNGEAQSLYVLAPECRDYATLFPPQRTNPRRFEEKL